MFPYPRVSKPVVLYEFQPPEAFEKAMIEYQQRRIDRMKALWEKGDVKSMIHFGLIKVGILVK